MQMSPQLCTYSAALSILGSMLAANMGPYGTYGIPSLDPTMGPCLAYLGPMWVPHMGPMSTPVALSLMGLMWAAHYIWGSLLGPHNGPMWGLSGPNIGSPYGPHASPSCTFCIWPHVGNPHGTHMAPIWVRITLTAIWLRDMLHHNHS